MTPNEIDAMRAKAIAAHRQKYFASEFGGNPTDYLGWDDFNEDGKKLAIEEARAIREADTEAGLVTVPIGVLDVVKACACDCAEHQCEANGWDHRSDPLCCHLQARAIMIATVEKPDEA